MRSQEALPGPREPGHVDMSKSDRELFSEAAKEGWDDELADVPWLPGMLNHGTGWKMFAGSCSRPAVQLTSFFGSGEGQI